MSVPVRSRQHAALGVVGVAAHSAAMRHELPQRGFGEHGTVNGAQAFSGMVKRDLPTLLKWAARDSAPGSRVVNFTRNGEKRFAELFGKSE